MTDLVITSAANPRLKQLAGLRRRRGREQLQLTLIDGYAELQLALQAGVSVRTLYYCPDLMSASEAAALGTIRAAAQESVRLSRAAFEKVAYREGADGYLAVADGIRDSLADLVVPANPLVLLAEGVEKPGNLGAMLRTADAVGVDAMIAADPVTDWGNPNVVRASKGTVFAVPVASAPVSETLAFLRDRGIRIYATTPDTRTLHTQVDWTGPVAVAVGTEKYGLSDHLLEHADERIRIPMHGVVNSLNVSIAAAVVLYEAQRHRAAAVSPQG